MRSIAEDIGFAQVWRGQRITRALVALAVAALVLAAPTREGSPPRQIAPGPNWELQADFNGDGYQDLAVGVPGETLTDAAEGAVHVIYGGQDGLNGDTPVDDQVWTQNRLRNGEISERSDRFGHSLAWGDFDGDGYHDLAIGVPYEDLYDDTSLPVVPDAGMVQVIYGSPAGLTSIGTMVFYQSYDAMRDLSEADDRFGWALAARNFGGGPETDLAVGIPGENLGVADAGAVSVIYGSPTGLTTTGNQFWWQDSPDISGVAEAGDQFGYSLAAANFGNGSLADLAIGVPYEDLDPVTQQDAGTVNVIYGSSTGLTATGNRLWHQDSPDIGGVAEAGDHFGYSLAAANLGNSAEADLAVGVPDEDVNDPDAGAVNVIYGSATGLAAGGTQLWHTAVLGFYNQTGTRFGYALAAANFGRDGQADLAVGVPFAHVQEYAAGAVIVLYGATAGLSDAGWNFWSQHGDLGGEAEASDLFGKSLAAANFGKGSEADLAVGVPGEAYESFFGDDPGLGAVNVIYGSTDGLTSAGNQFWWQRSDALHDSGEPWDHFGSALA